MANAAGDRGVGPEPQQPDGPTVPDDVLEAEERIKAQLQTEAAKKRRTVLLLLGLIAVALGTLGWEIWHYHVRLHLPAPNPVEVEIEVFDPIGSPEAKVKIVVVVEKCLESVQSLTYHIGKSYPDLVRAEFYAVHDGAAQQFAGEREESCAGVLVNGEDHFTVTDDAGTRDVHFYMNPGGSYTEEDLVAIIKREMAQAYGAVPEDFDQKVSLEFDVGIPPAGAPEAGVRVQVCLQRPTDRLIDLLRGIGNAFPSRVRIEFMGFTTQAAQVLLADAEGYEPCIFVNGKKTFTFGTAGPKREVTFVGDPGPVYGLADVVAAVSVELAATRGGLPPTFDEVATIPELAESPSPTPAAQ